MCFCKDILQFHYYFGNIVNTEIVSGYKEVETATFEIL